MSDIPSIEKKKNFISTITPVKENNNSNILLNLNNYSCLNNDRFYSPIRGTISSELDNPFLSFSTSLINNLQYIFQSETIINEHGIEEIIDIDIDLSYHDLIEVIEALEIIGNHLSIKASSIKQNISHIKNKRIRDNELAYKKLLMYEEKLSSIKLKVIECNKNENEIRSLIDIVANRC